MEVFFYGLPKENKDIFFYELYLTLLFLNIIFNKFVQ